MEGVGEKQRRQPVASLTCVEERFIKTNTAREESDCCLKLFSNCSGESWHGNLWGPDIQMPNESR